MGSVLSQEKNTSADEMGDSCTANQKIMHFQSFTHLFSSFSSHEHCLIEQYFFLFLAVSHLSS